MDKIFIKSLHNYYCKKFDTIQLQTKASSLSQNRKCCVIQNRKRCVTFTKSSRDALLALNKLAYN